MRTSLTHPLQIASIEVAPGYGQIGITFCPGKQQAMAATGAWSRDLALDLDAIAEWGAAAVVTLVEKHELKQLKVADLGQAVEARHMAWYHLPIADAGVPDDEFLLHWWLAGEELRAMLRDGFNVLFHCKGGLGRAGTVAAQVLIELGMDNDQARYAVREARPGAIENSAQMVWLARCQSLGEPLPYRSEGAIADRAAGALLGLAIGDAIGTALEFAPRDSKPRLTRMVGGGPFRLQPGQWTDDTAMALALADSLLANASLDEADLMRRFVRWHEEGEYSCTGSCFDIGITTRRALATWKQTGNPFAGSADPRSAGNGSLMRLAPVAIRHWQDRKSLRDVAARQSRTTHGAPEAVDACIGFAQLLANAIAGHPRSAVMRAREGADAGAIGPILAGSWRGKHRSKIASSGYVAHALEAALWCVGRTGGFEDAVLLAANLGDDADTTAAITGQLAGALYGARMIPDEWLATLAWKDEIEAKATALFEASRLSRL
jgi:ADP-ribosyl-[dinitrogen reductase] hydrolase